MPYCLLLLRNGMAGFSAPYGAGLSLYIKGLMHLLFSSKIVRIDILDKSSSVIMTVERNFNFPKNLGSDDESILIIKGSSLKELEHNSSVDVIATTKAGERIRYVGRVSMSMPKQLNISLSRPDETEVLQERRRYFKIKTHAKGRALFFMRGEESVRFEFPEEIEIMDINIGGIFMKCDGCTFEAEDLVCVDIDLFVDYKLNAVVKVLRVQPDDNGGIKGYGCEFQGLTAAQEDYIGKYIYKVQSDQRQKEMAQEQNF